MGFEGDRFASEIKREYFSESYVIGENILECQRQGEVSDKKTKS
jgi:hypothetical protein